MARNNEEKSDVDVEKVTLNTYTEFRKCVALPFPEVFVVFSIFQIIYFQIKFFFFQLYFSE